MLQDFTYSTPTKIIFGKDSLNSLTDAIKKFGKRVLLAYGGGSIKKNALYDRVMALLKDFEVTEFGGVHPNPKYVPDVTDGVRLCKEKNIDVVLAVGGGSVVDCAKVICAGALYEGETWDLICGKAHAKGALPLIDILTLAATGSEYDNGGVISRPDTLDKICYKSEHIFPKVSILDPRLTYTVSRKQTAAGIVDAISHVLEQYFCEESTFLTDGLCEAVIRSLITCTSAVMEDLNDYQARGEIMLCCSLACNGILSIGNSGSGWPCHAIEHALSGFYDIVHGEGLAIIIPAWMRYVLGTDTVARFALYGRKIWKLEGTDAEVATLAVNATENFFRSLGMPSRLQDVGIDAERFHEMAKHIAGTEKTDSAWPPLNEEDIFQILTSCL